MAKPKYYGVRSGREGAQVYDSWNACEASVHGFSQAVYKSFKSEGEARAFAGLAAEPIVLDDGITDDEERPAQRRRVGEKEEEVVDLTEEAARPSSPKALTRDEFRMVRPSARAGLSGAASFQRPATVARMAGAAAPRGSFSGTAGAAVARGTGAGAGASGHAPQVELSEQQKRVVRMVEEGSNVFFTGVAGTGKSVTLGLAVAALRRKYGHESVAVCAPTGVAAVNVGGQTIHSLSGAGVPTVLKDYDKMFGVVAKQRWTKLSAVVLDEVGMVPASFLDWLDVTVRVIRKRQNEPFGGIQLVFCGDFAQLPPVRSSRIPSVTAEPPAAVGRLLKGGASNERPEKQIPVDLREVSGAFAFQTALWREARFEAVLLTEIFRQKEVGFVRALQKLREGDGFAQEVQYLLNRVNRELPDLGNGIKPTVLYCRNVDVDRENEDNMKKLDPSTHHVYAAKDMYIPHENAGPGAQEKLRTVVQRDMATRVLEKVELRVGAQVMLTKNEVQAPPTFRQDDALEEEQIPPHLMLVNGSRGVVIGFAASKRDWRERNKRGAASGPVKAEAAGDVKAEAAGDVKAEAAGDVKAEAAGDGKAEAAGDGKAEAAGDVKAEAAGDVKAEALENALFAVTPEEYEAARGGRGSAGSSGAGSGAEWRALAQSAQQTSQSALLNGPQRWSDPKWRAAKIAQLREAKAVRESGNSAAPSSVQTPGGMPITLEYPVVQFANGRIKVVMPEDFEAELYMVGKAIRRQVPLRLAWALTIHKAQGQTLDQVIVDLDGAFDNGQVYVALSRARDTKGLQVRNYEPGRVSACPLAGRFHSTIAQGGADVNAAMTNFLNSSPPWWAALYAKAAHPQWSILFESDRRFARWKKTYGPWQ